MYIIYTVESMHRGTEGDQLYTLDEVLQSFTEACDIIFFCRQSASSSSSSGQKAKCSFCCDSVLTESNASSFVYKVTLYCILLSCSCRQVYHIHQKIVIILQ